MFNKSLYIFRRDLRLEDNTALLEALKFSREVMTCFVFDPRQIEKQPYRSANAVQFMILSLLELADELKKRGGRLFFFYGCAETVVARLIKKEKLEAVYLNSDYTPFSRARDEAVRQAALSQNAAFFSMFDALLVDPAEFQKKSGGAYSVFTPFYNAASKLAVAKARSNRLKNYYSGEAGIEEIKDVSKLLPPPNRNIFREGGRKEALDILAGLGRLCGYEQERNIPALAGTSGLSAHNKFGTVSIREVREAIIKKLGAEHALMRQLFWRDFFCHVAYHFPHVFKGAFHRKYDAIVWNNDRKRFKLWREGRTGFPLVDAGMRELNQSGYMHNRVRMLTASFLVKDLHISWRWGEKYFAQKLVDYDPAVNNGSWQWSASTGCDAQPYFRIFNPWLQQKRFDPECIYIKRWIPELKDFPAGQIHDWAEKRKAHSEYPPPMLDHSEQKQIAEELFEEC